MSGGESVLIQERFQALYNRKRNSRVLEPSEIVSPDVLLGDRNLSLPFSEDPISVCKPLRSIILTARRESIIISFCQKGRFLKLWADAFFGLFFLFRQLGFEASSPMRNRLFSVETLCKFLTRL